MADSHSDDLTGEVLSAACPSCGDFDCLLERPNADGGWKRAWCKRCGVEVEESRESPRWPGV